jgi:hypothetical protein
MGFQSTNTELSGGKTKTERGGTAKKALKTGQNSQNDKRDIFLTRVDQKNEGEP